MDDQILERVPTTVTELGIVAVADKHQGELPLPVACDRTRGYYEIAVASTSYSVYQDKTWHMFVAYSEPGTEVHTEEFGDCTILYLAPDEDLEEVEVSVKSMDLGNGAGERPCLVLSLHFSNVDQDVPLRKQNLFLDHPPVT